MITVIVGALSAVLLVIYAGMLMVATWDRHNAPLAFAQCAKMCGPIGVHRADPDYKCECNETKRFEGAPSLDLNINQRGEK